MCCRSDAQKFGSETCLSTPPPLTWLMAAHVQIREGGKEVEVESRFRKVRLEKLEFSDSWCMLVTGF